MRKQLLGCNNGNNKKLICIYLYTFEEIDVYKANPNTNKNVLLSKPVIAVTMKFN